MKNRFCLGFVLIAVLLVSLRGLDARAAAGEWASNAHGAARLITAVEATGTNQQLDVGLQLRLTPGWHTYWRTPGDAGFPPSIDWKGSTNLASATIAWPAPQRLPPAGELETIGYMNGVVLPISVRLLHPGQPLHLHAEVDYASCKDICIPYHANLDLVLPAGAARPGPEAQLLAAALARVPVDASAVGIQVLGAVAGETKEGAALSVRLASDAHAFRSPDLFVEGLAKSMPGRPGVALAAAGRLVTFNVPLRGEAGNAIAGTRARVTLVDGARAAETDVTPTLGTLPPVANAPGLLTMIGFALLGGLILNLMPCVLPVLSLKLLALAGHAGAEIRAARLGMLAAASGVLVSFGVLASVLIVLQAAGAAIGWGIQFQQPWFLAGMALVTTLFAASLWGWLPIALPGYILSTVGAVRGRRRFSDAFLAGAFATLLAASCSAPFVGTAVGFALSRGPAQIAAMFGVLGIGMASPFLAVAAAPRIVAYIPRPGRWMGWLQRILGVALLGTAAWLIWVLGLEAGPEIAVFAGGVLGVLLLALALRQIVRPAEPARRILGTAAVALSAITVLVPSLRDQAAPVAAFPTGRHTGNWRLFDQASIARNVTNGKLVFVDVTAAWCLTCKVNELNVLDRAPVWERLREPGVIAMRADWTRPNPLLTTYMQAFDRYGVPLYVVYGPGAPGGIVLPELLTSNIVMNALRRASTSAARDGEVRR